MYRRTSVGGQKGGGDVVRVRIHNGATPTFGVEETLDQIVEMLKFCELSKGKYLKLTTRDGRVILPLSQIVMVEEIKE